MKSWIWGLSKWFINCQRHFVLAIKSSQVPEGQKMAEINFPERLSAVISVMTGNVALSNSFKGTIIHIAIMDFSFCSTNQLCKDKWLSKLHCSSQITLRDRSGSYTWSDKLKWEKLHLKRDSKGDQKWPVQRDEMTPTLNLGEFQWLFGFHGPPTPAVLEPYGFDDGRSLVDK